jgi:hypothetical protein
MGVHGLSEVGEGVRGETHAQFHAAVAGFNHAPNPGHTAPAWGVFGGSFDGIGVHGETTTAGNHAAVVAINRGSGQGPGVFAHSEHGEGVHGETNAQFHAAVAGFNRAPSTGVPNQAPAWGVFGLSVVGDGVHGETSSQEFSGVAGIANNTDGGNGIYGESRGGYAGFFKGNVFVTGVVQSAGGDCAEEFDIAVAEMEMSGPGTVMVIEQESTLRPSQQAYDKRVAGVISGAGQCKPGFILAKRAPQENRLPIALMGKVYCKVDAQYAPIEVGDLLTTSPTPGHAMKAEDPLKAFGAVIGKALCPWEAGQGLIPILIALQ